MERAGKVVDHSADLRAAKMRTYLPSGVKALAQSP